jgi:tetratricopeptide (TPR) repeat protein
MNAFFRELKQRKVYRVALGYAVAAWLVIQIVFTVLPSFHVPEWLLQALAVLAALDFPAALVLAWAFDVTPSGIEKTPEGTPAVAARNMRYGWWLAAARFAVAALAIGSYWLWHPWRHASTEAYDLFLRGEYELHQAKSSAAADAYDRADAFYRQALARDPNFAEAAAELAHSRLLRHWLVSPLTVTQLEEVKSLIDHALTLAPNSPEAHFALGLFFYWGHRQYEMPLTEFNRTLELQPNNALARAYCAWVYCRRGEWERSLADSQRAQELDPRDARTTSEIGSTYTALRLWKDAGRAELRALAIDPHNMPAALALLITRLNGTGDVDSARQALDGFPQGINFIDSVVDRGDVARIIDARVYLDVTERRFDDAFQAIEKDVVNDDRAHLQQLAGRAALRVLAGQTDATKSAGVEALLLLEARLRERQDDTLAMTWLSWVYLALGRNADALRFSRQAADTISIEKDALAGPYFQNGLAQIESRAGAFEEAIKRLRRLLSIPAGGVPSIARLKIDPVWDPIRNRPDFQQLFSGPEQIGPNK